MRERVRRGVASIADKCTYVTERDVTRREKSEAVTTVWEVEILGEIDGSGGRTMRRLDASLEMSVSSDMTIAGVGERSDARDRA